ncbi:MAG TPA: type II toxin-antitoxin system RelE/ParE family toxin [Methylomirabilota bacterium]|nr:type II toxin-antitoxin system RelE/ParE family toxin [Methylomirabilota bacterium]
MSFNVIFKTEAEAEFNEAIAWYDLQTDGVGQRFAREVNSTLFEAAKDRERFPFAGPTTQKIKMLDWPYSIYFTLLEDSAQLIVVSVFHGARNPAELRRRLK